MAAEGCHSLSDLEQDFEGQLVEEVEAVKPLFEL
jgi:hypothetical protein